MDRKIPSLLGLALTILRTAHGWTAKALSEKLGIPRSTISAYESGDVTLARERLEELAQGMELEPKDVEAAVVAASLVLPAAPLPWTPVDPTAEERRIIDKASVMGGREAASLVDDTLLQEVREYHSSCALAEGRELAKRLKQYPAEAQRDLVEGNPDYQHWGLAMALCEDSEKAAAAKPARAVELAELALHVARHVPGTEGWRSRLMGRCTGFLANAQRAGSDLRGAEATFARAWQLWRAGEDEAGLLSEAYLLDMEASLRRAQRRLHEALRLHKEALRVVRPEEKGMILLNRAGTLHDMGHHEAALETLDQAAQAIDGRREPRLRFGVLFKRAANLCRMGRAVEAARLVPEVRELAERLPQDRGMDLVRTQWLEGNVAAGLGRREEARAALEQVRLDFERLKIPYDYAMVSLDLALVYREEGRFAEIKSLAGEMLEIFQAQGVHREPISALLLFREAAEKEQVTIELVRRLQDYLGKARSQPQLCFKP